jgi:hypothetical protein
MKNLTPSPSPKERGVRSPLSEDGQTEIFNDYL